MGHGPGHRGRRPGGRDRRPGGRDETHGGGPDVLVRATALEALASAGCPAPLDAETVAALGNAAWQVRKGAATAPSAAGPGLGGPALARALGDAHADVRKAAVPALRPLAEREPGVRVGRPCSRSAPIRTRMSVPTRPRRRPRVAPAAGCPHPAPSRNCGRRPPDPVFRGGSAPGPPPGLRPGPRSSIAGGAVIAPPTPGPTRPCVREGAGNDSGRARAPSRWPCPAGGQGAPWYEKGRGGNG